MYFYLINIVNIHIHSLNLFSKTSRCLFKFNCLIFLHFEWNLFAIFFSYAGDKNTVNKVKDEFDKYVIFFSRYHDHSNH